MAYSDNLQFHILFNEMRWLRENALPNEIDSMYCRANENVVNIFSAPFGKGQICDL